jgi:hypothetical protein
MAKQIHVLDQQTGSDDGTRTIRCVFWYPVIGVTRQIPIPGFKSNAPAANVSVQDQADLESGALLEEMLVFAFPTSYTTAQMKALINQRYTDKAAAIAADPAKRAFYGVFFDSVTGWSA